MAKMGRPKKVLDFETIEKLAMIQCTQEEIASFIGVSVDTLRRSEEFCNIYKKGQENGKMSLRRIQFKLAEHNTTMAIWLGKQYLGQTEKIETTQKDYEEHNKMIHEINLMVSKPVKDRKLEDYE